MTSPAHRDPALFRSTLELLPAGAYTCDAAGRITWFNELAALLWGRRPRLDDDAVRYCGSMSLLSPHMQPIEHHACWMALALRDRRAYLGQEFVIVRPDHSQVTVLAYATPLMDEDGKLMGAVNILVNISDRKRVEQLLADANRANEYYRAAVADAMRDELAPMDAALAQLERLAGTAFEVEQLAILRRQITEMANLIDQLVSGRGNRQL
jgi:PAS domain S-box-containing protein